MAPVVFMVAEKPSLAESIAKTLSQGRCASRKGFNGACSVHDWNGPFMGQTAHFKMTSVCGHVMTTNFVGHYNNWESIDPVQLFVAPIEKIEANPKLRMVEFLKKESAGAQDLVLWLDCDKEGENICFEVIDACYASLQSPRRVQRAHFTAVTEQEIFHAINNLRQPNENESLSVDARQELDLRIGCAFTRFQTKFFQGKYGDLNSRLVSYGPCQTPTLGFCVKRHDRIRSFKPEPFWRIQVAIWAEPKTRSDEVILDWDRDRVFDRDAANYLLNGCKSIKQADITDVSRKTKSKPRPQGLNTVEMLRVASSSLSIGPQQCMQIAERLYTSGYINYPRTETTAYPPSMDLKSLVKSQTSHPEWGSVAGDVLSVGINQPRKGTDAGDHPPICPMRMARPQELGGNDAARLYEYICRHFIATLMRDCSYESTKVSFRLGEESFSTSSSVVVDPGFTRAMPWHAITDVQLNAELLKKGANFPVTNEPSLYEGRTQPPDYLTEADLITAMEKHGIGTDASIPVHIGNIAERGYVELQPGRKLKPTNLGIVLVHGYQGIDPELVLPHMRRAVEEQLNKIAQGQAQFQSVLRYAIAVFVAKYRFFVENISPMDQLFEASFTTLAQSGRPFSRCGKCHKYMKLIESKPQRLHCQFCNETYALPQMGSVRNYKETKCPLDDFEVVLWTQGSKGKSFLFCPYCYLNPPFEDMHPGQASCNQCKHPSCQHSMISRAVYACHQCRDGLMLLDDSVAPKFRLQCNKCDAIILFADCVRGVTTRSTRCETCTARNLLVKVDVDKCKIEGVTGTVKGCVFCHEQGHQLLLAVKAIATNFGADTRKPHRGGRAGSRGGGRSARGDANKRGPHH